MKEEEKRAVALKYRKGVDSAPRVVAKGRGEVAERIIALAREHGIPIYMDRDLVEVVSSLDLYEEIPEELYRAVAEVLVFVYRLTRGQLD